MSKIFKQVVEEFAGYINLVIFTIIENRRDSDPLKNFKLFCEYFGSGRNDYKEFGATTKDTQSPPSDYQINQDSFHSKISSAPSSKKDKPDEYMGSPEKSSPHPVLK